MTRSLSIAAALLSAGIATGAAEQTAAPSGACTQWNVAGSWVLTQSNGPVVKAEVRQTDGVLSGTATYDYDGEGGIFGAFGGTANGTIRGTVSGEHVRFSIEWDG